MRHVGAESQFTPFGMWLRQYCRGGRNGGAGLAITNLDYILDDYQNKRLMLIEEKQNNGVVHNAQRMTFQIIDRVLWSLCAELSYRYWGLFVLQMPGTMPGPGMKLNGKTITAEELCAHCDFEAPHCEPFFPSPADPKKPR